MTPGASLTSTALALRRRTGALLAALVVAIGLAACGGNGDEPASPPAPDVADEVPKPTEVEFDRVQGFTTISESDLDGDELANWRDAVPEIEDVRISSTADDHRQPALWLPPPDDEEAAPLLVLVHSWSFGYRQNIGIPFAQWAEDHGWGMIAPQFRGPFDRSQATGSDLAVQDVVDAVDFAIDEADVDEDRVYLIGVSGGGMMSLLMAGRHPDRFAGAAAWVPIHNLVQWYDHNVTNQPEEHYAENIADSCGGDPLVDEEARAECEHRSPEAHLEAARDDEVPIYIGHGLDDEVVPPSHSLWAYNQLAEPEDRIDDHVVRAVGQNRLPDRLDGSIEAEDYFGGPDPQVYLARQSGPVTLVIFEGEHDMAYHPGLEWMTELAASG